MDTPEVSGDVLVWVAVVGVVAIILMAAFLAFLNYRDRKKDRRHKK